MSLNKKERGGSKTLLIVEYRPFKKKADYAPGISRNFSREEFSFESQHYDLKQGQILEFKIKHPESDLTVSAIGEIVWKEEKWYKCTTGIRLKEMDEKAKGQILNLFSTDTDVPASTVPADVETELEHEKKEEPAAINSTGSQEKPELEIAHKDDKGISELSEPGSVENPLVKGTLFNGHADDAVSVTETKEQTEMTKTEEPFVSGSESISLVNEDDHEPEVEDQGEKSGPEMPLITASQLTGSHEEAVEETSDVAVPEKIKESERTHPQTPETIVETSQNEQVHSNNDSSIADTSPHAVSNEEKTRRFMPLVAAIAIIITVTAVITFEEIQKGLTHFIPSTGSISLRDSDKRETGQPAGHRGSDIKRMEELREPRHANKIDETEGESIVKGKAGDMQRLADESVTSPEIPLITAHGSTGSVGKVVEESEVAEKVPEAEAIPVQIPEHDTDDESPVKEADYVRSVKTDVQEPNKLLQNREKPPAIRKFQKQKKTEEVTQRSVKKEETGGKSYLIQVGAWKSKDRATEILSELKKNYPEAYIMSQNNFQIIMIPNVTTRKQGYTISKKLEKRFYVKPIITLSSREKKQDKTTSAADLRRIRKEVLERKTSVIKRASLNSEVSIPKGEPGEIKSNAVAETEHIPLVKNRPVQNGEPDKNREVISASTGKKFIAYKESFDNNINKWDIFDTGRHSARIVDGAYIIENKDRVDERFIFHYHDFPHNADFIIEITVEALRSSDDSSYGFVFGAKDYHNNYTFRITDDKRFIINEYHNGIAQVLTGGKIGSEVINHNSFNILTIVKQGSNIRFYVNNTYLDKLSRITFYGSKVGFVVGGNSKIAIDSTHCQIRVADR